MKTHDVVIVGAGAAGIATAASLKKRKSNLDILIIVRPKNITISLTGRSLAAAFLR